MTKDYLSELMTRGYIDEELIVAEVKNLMDNENYVLCVSGVIVTLADALTPQKIFSDSTDRLYNVNVKSGLFKKQISFEYNNKHYIFVVKGGKKLVEYFGMIKY